ncbi:MAG: hypothetical protein JO033_22655 [Acidobacteriaceae bacterium]|nr:hypothetical protein [Acidobacteriaceae bacterium]
MSWTNYFGRLLIGGMIVLPVLAQQTSPDALQQILHRLDTLERQNQALLAEIQELKKAIKTSQESAPAQTEELQEKVNTTQQEVKDQAQTKVEASHRFPVSLTGMFLFDAFATGGQTGYAVQEYGPYGTSSPNGATLRQSIIGFDFRGPQLPGGGKVWGSLQADFFAQVNDTDYMRLRRGIVVFDWRARSLTFGQDRSIIAPLEPDSVARVGIPPLAGAGNLWLWRPQATYEERIPIGADWRLALQGSVFETDESYATSELPSTISPPQPRPAGQVRVEFSDKPRERSRFAVGLGFDHSSTHLLGQSAPSQVVSVDFRYRPFSKMEVTGGFFQGKNFANLGGEPPGVTIENGIVVPIRGAAGWMQAAFPVTPRITFDIYAGRQVNNPHDLNAYEVERTLNYAGNIIYRVAPNVVLSFEASQNRLQFLASSPLLTNRYDATVAYLF